MRDDFDFIGDFQRLGNWSKEGMKYVYTAVCVPGAIIPLPMCKPRRMAARFPAVLYAYLICSAFACGSISAQAAKDPKARTSWDVADAPCRMVVQKDADDYFLVRLPADVDGKPVSVVKAFLSGDECTVAVVWRDGHELTVLINASAAKRKQSLRIYPVPGDSALVVDASHLVDPAPLRGKARRTGGMDLPSSIADVKTLETRCDGRVAHFAVKDFARLAETFDGWFRGDWTRKSHLVDLQTWLLVPSDGMYMFGLAGVAPSWLLVDGKETLAHPANLPHDQWTSGTEVPLKAGLRHVLIRTVCRQKIDTGLAWKRAGEASGAVDVAMVTGGDLRRGRWERRDRRLHPFATVESGAAYRFAGTAQTFVPFTMRDGSSCWGTNHTARWEVKFRSQESGDRSQESGGRSQESGVRSQESGDRSQESGDRSQKSGVRSQETGDGAGIYDRVTQTPNAEVTAGSLGSGETVTAVLRDDQLPAAARLTVDAASGEREHYEIDLEYDGPVWKIFDVTTRMAGVPAVCYEDDRVNPIIRVRTSADDGLTYVLHYEIKWRSKPAESRSQSLTVEKGWARVYTGEVEAGEIERISWSLRHQDVEISRGAARFAREPYDFLPDAVSGEALKSGSEFVMLLTTKTSRGDPAPASALPKDAGVVLLDGCIYGGAGYDANVSESNAWHVLDLRATEQQENATGTAMLMPFAAFKSVMPAAVVVYAPSFTGLDREGGTDAFERRLSAMTGLAAGPASGNPRVLLVVPPMFDVLTGCGCPPGKEPCGHAAKAREYAETVIRVADAHGVETVDLFTAFQTAQLNTPLISNGALTETGVELAETLIRKKILAR